MVPRDSETHEFSFRLGPEIFFYFLDFESVPSFQDETFGAIKIFLKFFLGRRFTGSGPEMKTN